MATKEQITEHEVCKKIEAMGAWMKPQMIDVFIVCADGKKCACDSVANAFDHMFECFENTNTVTITKETMSVDRFESMREFEG